MAKIDVHIYSGSPANMAKVSDEPIEVNSEGIKLRPEDAEAAVGEWLNSLTDDDRRKRGVGSYVVLPADTIQAVAVRSSDKYVVEAVV